MGIHLTKVANVALPFYSGSIADTNDQIRNPAGLICTDGNAGDGVAIPSKLIGTWGAVPDPNICPYYGIDPHSGAEAVINDKAVPDSRVFDVLTRGILTLPDYLARLQYGQLDVPLKHLTLINELRAAHNAPPISELELFSPDLSVRPPPAAQPASTLSAR